MKLFGRAEVDLMVSLGQFNQVTSLAFITCSPLQYSYIPFFIYRIRIEHFSIALIFYCFRSILWKMKMISNLLLISKPESG